MASIHELLAQVQDEALRAKLEEEVKKLSKQKKFGLVFEEHLPECTPLYGLKIRRGTTVARKEKINDTFTVLKVEGDVAVCKHKKGEDLEEIPLAELVPVAEFGEPIYPYLQPIDTVCNAPDSDLWHTLIEADNYHALQLLEYLYAGKVDCIYIDPPYNTGAKDWKYNNDYVDGNDSYRHSKWLSMMQKRLKIAKKLLNPADSVLIVTIDEKEYLHLGCLLEEMFPEARLSMISDAINPNGVAKSNDFSRAGEYIFLAYFGDSGPSKLTLSDEWAGNSKNSIKGKIHWSGLMRTGTNSLRTDRPNLFYPIYVSKSEPRIVEIGNSLPLEQDRHTVKTRDDCYTIFPIHTDGSEGNWMQSPPTLEKIYGKGYVKIGKAVNEKVTISYLPKGKQEMIESGLFPIVGYREDGSVIVDDSEGSGYIPDNQWRISTHDASRNGSNLIQSILASKRFSFPKSLYSVYDIIKFFVINKPNALILDFFAGSGTTLHAVNLLNAEDGGKRRCIMVTNNEVSDAEAKEMKANGLNPGDEEWEKLGIARYVTWPRTVCSIEGHDVNGNPLKGNYIGSDIPMADGFKANAAFFKLGFLDKNAVQLGRQFKEMLPTLWMKAGAKGKCPEIGEKIPVFLIFTENKFAVLIDEKAFADFEKQVLSNKAIETVYIITDSEFGYKSMISKLRDRNTYQLYRDYLDNFRINIAR